MPVVLSEIINQNNSYGGKNKVKPNSGPKSNYTMIDDLVQGFEPMPLNQYNSNDSLVIESNKYVKAKNKINASIPDEYIKNNNLSNFSPTLRNQFRNEQMRDISFNQDVQQDSKDFFPVSQAQMGSIEAGGVPMMKNASGKNDLNAQMNGKSKEGFSQMHRYQAMMGGQSCIDTLNHVMSCPMCARYFQCDNKVYNVIIIMLIVLFATIVYFLYREEKR